MLFDCLCVLEANRAAGMSAKALLRLLSVSHFYGSRLIFKDVSCTLEAGRILLVAGPNGAGKSTLLKLMAGLLRPATGRIERLVSEAEMAFMGHQTFVYPGLSALANLEFWNKLYRRNLDDAALIALLGRVGLKGFALEKARTFSRGMAQRLSLARVLLIDPRLIFLDEPSTGLDTLSQTMLYNELGAARERGASIVWISHDVERDAQRADLVLHLCGQKTQFLGPAMDFVREKSC